MNFLEYSQSMLQTIKKWHILPYYTDDVLLTLGHVDFFASKGGNGIYIGNWDVFMA